MTVGDIYYVLFRHKWKILLCTFAGLAAGACVYFLDPPRYQSQAKLFVRYIVTEGKSRGPTVDGDESTMKSPDQGGETIMDSEVEILGSLDLAKQVAEAVGPEKIIGNSKKDANADYASILIRKGMTVDVPPRSSVIDITFKHPDPEVVQPVLREMIDHYLKMHLEVHHSVGLVAESVAQETDQLRAHLEETEEELRKANTKAGVTSIADAKKTYADQVAELREEIFGAQAELAERSSVVQEVTNRSPVKTPAASGAPVVPQEKFDSYRDLQSRLDYLKKNEQGLLTEFTPENSRVMLVRQQITDTEAQKTKLEQTYPGLLNVGIFSPGSNPSGQSIDPAAEAVKLTALQAKIKVLNMQLAEVRNDQSNIDQMEETISELTRKKDLEEANYKYWSAKQEQSRIDEALGDGRVSNISEIQTPSPPLKDWGKTSKVIIMVSASGLIVGLAWAFLIELYFDRTVRRPVDIERIMRLPLFLSIPRISRSRPNRNERAASESRPRLQAPKEGTPGSLVPWNRVDALYPFHETLRDRLISYFESQNLTHKPKLVAVTGLGRNAGVTTTAAGLAKSLSETGDGNVLLVDMTVGQGSAQQFYKGKAGCGLEELLSTRDNAQIETNLYVVGEGSGGDKLSKMLPQRFNKLVPKLKASDFDYIIFDMPPVSQISITPRLAGFMDMVLLVIESEKTDQDIVRRATELLGESKAHVGAVLNKTRTYVPPSLHQENLDFF